MESRETPIQPSILDDPHLWIAFVLAAIFVGMEILHVFNKLEEGPALHIALSVIVICILTLAADAIKKGRRDREDSKTLGRIDRKLDDIDAGGRKREEQERENYEKLSRLVGTLSDQKAALRKRPSRQDEYDNLWGGFTGSYDVYNPSYNVDQITGVEDILKTFVTRYQDPRFDRARYIFLTKDISGQEDLERFRRLMALVRQKVPDVDKKVKVKELKREASSMSEVYLGTRDGEPTAIVELKDSYQHGMSDSYLIIHDKGVCDHYRQHLFEQSWKVATDVDLWKAVPPQGA